MAEGLSLQAGIIDHNGGNRSGFTKIEAEGGRARDGGFANHIGNIGIPVFQVGEKAVIEILKLSAATDHHCLTGNIMIGMNKDECKLALGTPNFIERLPSNAGVIELWKYDNGYQLLFEDGVLKEYKQ